MNTDAALAVDEIIIGCGWLYDHHFSDLEVDPERESGCGATLVLKCPPEVPRKVKLVVDVAPKQTTITIHTDRSKAKTG